MRKIYSAAILYLLIIVFFTQEAFAQTRTETFNVEYSRWGVTNQFTWTVPCGVTSINVQAWGSGAGGNSGVGGGGGGAFSGTNNISVTPGATYTIIVGVGASRGSGGDGEFSIFRLGGTDIVTAEGGGAGSGNLTGGRASNSIGSIKYSGGDGGASASGRGGAGGGGSAGTTGNGSNGASNNNDNGGAGGNGGSGGGANGGEGGNRNQSGDNGLAPGAGGGERGSSGSNSGAGGDGQVIITYTGIADNYCTPRFYNTEPITLVNLDGQIINSTSANTNSPDYEDFCQTANLARGNSYNIKVKGNTVGNYTNYFTVFIDWDQDGNLNETGERYNIGTISNSNGTDSKEINATIAVPAGATLGLTKMRVYKVYGTYEDDACDNNSYGQAEDYLINVIGNCVQPTGATVTDGVNTSTSSLNVCNGTKVTLKQTGGTKGTGNWEWRSGSCNGTLVGTSNAQDAELEITPSVGTTTYYVHSTCGAGACASVTVVVNTDGTISYTSGGQNLAVCKGVAINPGVIYTVGGGATSASITWSPSAPAGVSGFYNSASKQFVISGTPTTAGTFTYTVTSGGNSPCTNASLSGTITVNEGPASLSYTNNNVTYCSGGPITPNQPTVTGGAATSYSVNKALPPGLSLDPTTGIITGTPTTATAADFYIITAHNDCGDASKTLTIAISNGDQVFNITPSGDQTICSGGSVAIGLSGSVTGITYYQLYRDAVAVGSAIHGTGNPIFFGNQTVAGTYTVRTTSSCATNMTGNTTISVTMQPNTQFTYSSYVFCKSGISAPATITGAPQTGVFSASPTTLVFEDNTTGEIDLDQTPAGTYTISYTVAAGGGCATYTYTQTNTVQVSAAPVAFEIDGGGEYCDGNGGLPITISSSQSGIKYQLYRNNIATATIIDGTGGTISFGNQTVAGIYTAKAYFPSGSACATWMDGEVEIIMHPKPAAIVINPATAIICQGEIVSLSASNVPPTSSPGSVTFPSGTIDGAIPNNSSTGIYNLIKLTGIPYGATITSVVVKFKITHSYDGDLLINLKGPNGKVLNIANGIGGSGNDFNTTTISSTSNNNISLYNPAYTGTYAPQGSIGVNGAQVVTNNISNVNTFAGLFGSTASSANGNWTLSVRDKEDHNNSNTGTFNNWEITINYTYTSNTVGVTWSPATDLFTDPGATTPYADGTLLSTVYAKPSTSKTFTATSTNSFGCSVTSTAQITVNSSPVISVSANYCDFPGKVRITATSDIAVNNWMWSGGIGAGAVSGNSSYIEPNTAGTFYVSAKSTGNGCAGFGQMSIAQELVVNGDFEQGNTGFTTDYNYVGTKYSGGNSGLWPDGTYSVANDPHEYHPNFWGTDHTTADGNGNYMLINGTSNKVVWKQTVTVLPNTTYYFSAYAVGLNSDANPANLVFKVNGVQVGSPTGPIPNKSLDNNAGTWKRFYGNWPSGTATSAIIEIIDLQNAPGGNDFGLDDISFGTLSTFFNLTSVPATENQSALCVGTPITDITYEVGGDGNPPTVFSGSIPPGLTTFWNGRNFNIYGIPITGGTFNFTLKSSGCNPRTKNVSITIDEPTDAGTFSNPVISTCYNTSATITLQGKVGNITKWQMSNDGGTNWTDVFKTTETIATPNVISTVLYKALVKNKSCSEAESPIVKVGIRNYWTGEKDQNFNDTKNWSDEVVPSVGGACPVVVIPAVTNLPILSSGNPNISSLQINATASLQINGTGILGIAGNITNNGVFDVKEGALEFNGAGAQTISGSTFKDRTIKDLTISNTAGLSLSTNLNDTLNITDLVSFGVSNATFATHDNLTLKSTAAGTASVGVLGPNNDITGKVTVERYINVGSTGGSYHGKSWQFVATPTKGQTVKESWMENGSSISVSTSYGTQIIGPGVGMDISTALPSLKYYDWQSNSWVGVTNTGNQVYDQRGYMLFVRGDRSKSFPNVGNTTLRTKGTLFTAKAGNTPPATTVKAGLFESVGNPYASAIDLRKFSFADGVNTTIIVWDPTITSNLQGSTYGLGAYQTLFTYNGNYVNLLSSIAYGDAFTPNNFIQSGQAFFIQTADDITDGTLSFTENMKASGSKLLLRAGNTNGTAENSSGLRATLYGINPDGSAFVTDGNLIQYNEDYSNKIDGLDARKQVNSTENLGIKSGGKDLVIERRHGIVETDTIFYNLTGVRAQNYLLEFNASDLSGYGVEGYVEDTYLNTQTPLKMDGVTKINFAVTGAAGSRAANRFRIVFRQAPAVVLPVTFVSVKAYQKDADVAVEWKMENEKDVQQYEVEKSADGVRFSKAATLDALNNGTQNYQWIDEQPAPGTNYYRIRSVGKDGKVNYSVIVNVAIMFAKTSIGIYPNPITDGIIHLQLINQPEGMYGMRLLNSLGQVIVSKQVGHAGGNATENIKWDYNLAHGVYHLEVTKPGGEVVVIKVMY